MNTIIKHLFIPYELAVIAKKYGFDEECMGFWRNQKNITFGCKYNNIITHRNTFLSIKGKENFVYTPEPKDADTNPNYVRLKWGIKVAAITYQQLIDWFREEHNLFIKIDNFPTEEDTVDYDYCICRCDSDVDERGNMKYIIDYSLARSFTYYEALNEAIEEAFKFI